MELQWACALGMPDAVVAILKHPHGQDSIFDLTADGDSTLHVALRAGHEDVGLCEPSA